MCCIRSEILYIPALSSQGLCLCYFFFVKITYVTVFIYIYIRIHFSLVPREVHCVCCVLEQRADENI
jgi:hypothetical protein